MSVTSTPQAPAAPRPTVRRPNMVSVGTIVWLASELMFFAALFAMYFTLRSVHPEVWKAETQLLNIPFAFVNTTILVLSSVTCQLGVFSAERGGLPVLGLRFRQWIVLTTVMGAFFVGGQAYEYAELVHKGLTITDSVYGSAFFLTTGFHALHVTGGLVAFLFLLGRTYMRPKLNHQMVNSAVVTSYYWHFVDIVWIGLFTIIYVIK